MKGDEKKMSFAEKVREKRKEAKMTQKELAEKVGISRPYLVQIEKEIRTPTIPVGYQIARVLDCTLDELAGENKKQIGG